MTKRRVLGIIDKAGEGDRASRLFDVFLLVLILSNVLAVVLGSFRSLPGSVVSALGAFEVFSVVVFTVEYGLRMWTSPLRYPGSRHPALRYAVSLMAIVDLLAILPFYLPFLLPFDLRFLRMLRLLRLLRIFKLNRYTDALNVIGDVLKREKEKLVTTIFLTSILILFASSVMYYVENEAQPDKFPNILASVWWAVATLTTVGYGDVYPVTVLGKLLSGIIAVLGIGLVALPTGIISSGFMAGFGSKSAKKTKVCPHCGGAVE